MDSEPPDPDGMTNDQSPGSSPDPSITVAVKTGENDNAHNVTTPVNIDDPVDIFLVETEHSSTAAKSGSESDETIINSDEPRMPQNNATPDDTLLQSPNARKFRLLYEDMRNRFIMLKNNCDDQMVTYENKTKEKDATIEELRTRIEEHDESKLYVMKMCNDDTFVAKLRRGVKGPAKRCGISGCGSLDVDLIRCSMCRNLVCENCSGTKIAKLRPIMNQCKSLYYTCPGCDVQIRDKSDVNAYDLLKERVEVLAAELTSCKKTKEDLTQQVKTLEDHQTSLLQHLEQRENSLYETEAKIVKQIQTMLERSLVAL